MTKREKDGTIADKDIRRDGKRQPTNLSVLSVIISREARTIIRTQTYVFLIGVITLMIIGLAVVNTGLSSGYGPVVVDLLTPMEFLAPLVAVTFGYKAILGDSQRGELEILQTYPVAAWQQTIGVFFGRALGVVAAILGPLILLGTAIAISSNRTWVFATPSGVDSPVLFIRFVILTILFSLVLLTIAIAISAIARTLRTGLILIMILLVGAIVGGDLGLITGLANDWLGDSVVMYTTALNPNSAYRGLVLETVIGTTTATKAASPLANILGLMLWAASGLFIAIVSLKRRRPCYL